MHFLILGMRIYKDYMSYHLDLSSKTIRNKWLIQVNSLMYREAMLYIHDHISRYNLSNWLYDASKFTAPDISDQIWTVEVLGELLAATSLQKIAVVVPKDIFLQSVAERVRDNAEPVLNGNIRLENFYDFTSAKEWLLS